MEFKKNDLVRFRHNVNDEEAYYWFTVEAEQNIPPDTYEDALTLGEQYVVQVLAITMGNGEVCAALCTESEIVFLPAEYGAVSFDDIIAVMRDGKDVTLTA